MMTLFAFDLEVLTEGKSYFHVSVISLRVQEVVVASSPQSSAVKLKLVHFKSHAQLATVTIQVLFCNVDLSFSVKQNGKKTTFFWMPKTCPPTHTNNCALNLQQEQKGYIQYSAKEVW